MKMRTRTVNTNYFEQLDNPNTWYVLGLLTTDGCLYHNPPSNYQINLYNKDLHFLTKIQKDLNSNHKIIQHNITGVYCFRVCNKKMYQDLISLGLYPNKTFTIELLDVEDSLFCDYLRGIFDGDGSTYYRINNQYRFTITSASKIFLEQIRVKLNQKGIYNTTKLTKHTQCDCYELCYYKKKSIKKIYDLLYYKPNLLKLEYKYEKFKKMVGDF